MGYFDEIASIAKAVSRKTTALSDLQGLKDQYKHKSFARGALDGTLQFPCLVSDAIPIDMGATIARTLERVYASFVQTYLSLNNTIDISVDKNPSMFLKRFHKNVRLEATHEDLYKENFLEADEEYDALMERIYDGTTQAYINEREDRMIVFNFSDKFNREVFESHREELELSLKDIDFTPFPNVSNSPHYKTKVVTEDFSTDELHDLQLGALKTKVNSQINTAADMSKEQFKLMNNDKLRVPQMTDNDVKKSNDMQPYLMQVRLMAINDENEFVQFMDFVVGVKVVLHNIKSNEMILNLQYALQNNGKIFNFIRWTTGEKSLVKDLLLNINDIKLDVANRSKGASPWWLSLKRMKEQSRAQAAFMSRTQFVPNSTIVISSYEADAIQKNYGYSLRDPRFAKKVMDSLFLMNFIIVDDGTRTVDILYDGETSYQTYALETLEREVTASSNKIGRELTRMISR